jgi:hypothetical protein
MSEPGQMFVESTGVILVCSLIAGAAYRDFSDVRFRKAMLKRKSSRVVE